MGFLRKVLGWVVGEDLAEQREAEAEKKKNEGVPRRRGSAPPAVSGDGFDAGPRAARAALGSTVEVPLNVPADVQPSGAAPAPAFLASFDDLKDLVDEPQEPRPEFIPEGGMSTESLMREFDSLDAEMQAAAVEAHARAKAAEVKTPPEAEVPPPAMSTEALLSEVSSLVEPQGDAPVTPAWLLPATTAAPPRPIPPPAPGMSTEALMSEFSALSEETRAQESRRREEAEAARVDAPAMATESLMSEFSSLSEETQAQAIALEAKRREEAEAARLAEAAKSAQPRPEKPLTPPWLIPATTAAPPRAVPPPAPAMSTESLMSEFSSLSEETQAQAVALEAKRREEVEAARIAMSTESLMSEFSSLSEETQAQAVAQEAKRREEAEAARIAEAAKSAQPRAEKPLTPPWLIPATTAALPRAVPPPAPAMSTESLMSEFSSLSEETQAQAIALEAKRREEAEAARIAMSTESPMSEFSSLSEETQAQAIALEAKGREEAEAARLAEAAKSAQPRPERPLTSAASPRAVPSPASVNSTESLSEETQAQAIAQEAKRREEAEAARVAEAAKSAPTQAEPKPLTPAWLIPATTAAPPPPARPPPTDFNASADDVATSSEPADKKDGVDGE